MTDDHGLTAFEMQVIAALAPRAGLAAQLFDAWCRLSTTASIHTAQSLTSLAGLGVTEERGAQEVLAESCRVGLLRKVDRGFVREEQILALMRRLVHALYAIQYYAASVHRDASSARILLTTPPTPCALEAELDSLGWRVGGLEPTTQAFIAMMQRAEHRAVVMTPFLDGRGATWLKQLFLHTKPGVSRILILRRLEAPDRPDYPSGFEDLRTWLAGHEVKVYNYSLARSGVPGRETFHAKVVLCDSTVAYVGSSNFSAASLEHSMEMGAAVEGRAARDVSLVVDAILQVASRVA